MAIRSADREAEAKARLDSATSRWRAHLDEGGVSVGVACPDWNLTETLVGRGLGLLEAPSPAIHFGQCEAPSPAVATSLSSPLSSKLRSLFPHDFAPKCDSALSQPSPSDVGPGPSGDCDRARGGKRRKATITTSSSFRASMSADVFRAPCMTGVTGPVLELRGRLQRSASLVLKIK